MSAPRLPAGSPRTLALNAADPIAASTDYTLNGELRPLKKLLRQPATTADPPLKTGSRSTLDLEARQLFRHRLALCCLIAAGPFAFFFVCSVTNFITLFGRSTVGWTGVGLSAVATVALLGLARFLFRARSLEEPALRAFEIAVFGLMAIFFAYWQFMLLTAEPPTPAALPHYEQSAVLAAATLAHLNWAALIVFHGVLVPNTLMRGASIAGAMVLAALIISTVAVFAHPPTGRNAGALYAVSVTLLAASAGLSIFGTAKTEALRREVTIARETIRELGQYRLKRKLGHGGMGEVFLAEHHLLKRPCAVKRIHPRYLNNLEQLRRFEREVQATAQLRHPNTVEIYDFGRADDGTFYYVMEYLAGLSLEDLVARHGPLPPGRVVHLLGQVAGALAEAHRYGMVHRDIKPSNVVIVPDGSPHDQVKVLDFGLVHSLADDLDPDSKITREGLIVGTPEYMSPEQASGSALDGRSDLFSLGSVAYYLLTGREVFHRDNPMKTLLAVVNDPPPPLVTFAPDTPSDLRRVVKTCLAKSLEQRFATARDLGQALAACACAGDWTASLAADWWATHADAPPDCGTDLDSLPLQPAHSPHGPSVAGRSQPR